MNIFACKQGACFFTGVAATIIGNAVVKCPKTRELTVRALAKGMKIKRNAQISIQNLKEDAEDLYHEAAVKAEEL